jgi:hypothetical protein
MAKHAQDHPRDPDRLSPLPADSSSLPLSSSILLRHHQQQQAGRRSSAGEEQEQPPPPITLSWALALARPQPHESVAGILLQAMSVSLPSSPSSLTKPGRCNGTPTLIEVIDMALEEMSDGDGEDDDFDDVAPAARAAAPSQGRSTTAATRTRRRGLRPPTSSWDSPPFGPAQ